MMVQCCAAVLDGGPALDHHTANIPCYGGVFVCEGGCFHMGVRWLVDRFTIRSTPRVPITPRALMCDSVVQSKMQYLLTFQVSRYCLLALQSTAHRRAVHAGPPLLSTPVPLSLCSITAPITLSRILIMEKWMVHVMQSSAIIIHGHTKYCILLLRFSVRTLPIPIITLLCK